MYVIPCQFTLNHNIFVLAFHGDHNVIVERGHYTHCCHRVCADYLPRFIEEGQKCKKCPNFSNIDYKSKCIELLGLWNCRDSEIDCISEFHAVLERCREFTKSKSGLVVQCNISPVSVLYRSTLQGLNSPKNIELHITYSNIPNSCLSKDTKPYWAHEKFNNEIMK
jgi:hypothetical protein